MAFISTDTYQGPALSRRALLLGGGALAATAALPAQAFQLQRSQVPGIDAGTLWVRLAGRDEQAHVRFRTPDGRLIDRGVQELSWTWRDWRDHDAFTWIDYRLFDCLALMQTRATIASGRPVCLHLTSGYRTRERNATIPAAAKNSQHCEGRAGDLWLDGFRPSETARLAQTCGAAGIGVYRNFTHVDVGGEGRRW